MDQPGAADSRPWTLTASWIIPVDGPPVRRGRLTIAAGRIAAVEPEGAGLADLDLGEAAILPGLVNAHTHLDLSGVARTTTIFTGDFTCWLRSVIRHRLARSPEQVVADIRAGLAQSLRYGVTLLGDVSSGGLSAAVLADAPLRSVVFHELLGLPAERAEAAFERARNWIQAQPGSGLCRPGLSPHAPYSVRAELFSRSAELARSTSQQRGVPVPQAVHLAETVEELRLLAGREGSFVGFLQELGVWDPGGLSANVAEVLARCAAAHPRLFIHGNYLTPEDPVPPASTVVYCPRTHAFFGHAPHPFRELLARGVRIALGTDSLASNPDLDVLAEARFLHALHPDVPPQTLLRMATLWGAEALGWDAETGSLTPGKSADLVVVPLEAPERSDPAEAVLASRTTVSRVMLRGRWL